MAVVIAAAVVAVIRTKCRLWWNHRLDTDMFGNRVPLVHIFSPHVLVLVMVSVQIFNLAKLR